MSWWNPADLYFYSLVVTSRKNWSHLFPSPALLIPHIGKGKEWTTWWARTIFQALVKTMNRVEFPFHRWGNWGSKNLSYLANITELVNIRARTSSRAPFFFSTQYCYFFILSLLCFLLSIKQEKQNITMLREYNWEDVWLTFLYA